MPPINHNFTLTQKYAANTYKRKSLICVALSEFTLKVLFTILQIARETLQGLLWFFWWTFYMAMPLTSAIWMFLYKRVSSPKGAIYGQPGHMKGTSRWLTTVFYPLMRICDTLYHNPFYCLNVYVSNRLIQSFYRRGLIVAYRWPAASFNESTLDCTIVSGLLVWHVFNLKDILYILNWCCFFFY